MPSSDIVEKRLAEILEMSYPKRRYYNVPPDIAVKEANNLYEWY